MGTTRFGANSIGSTAGVGAMAMPVAPAPDSGATLSACHWRCSSVESSWGRGNEAQATVLHSNASKPAAFQPTREREGAIARLNGCAWLVCINTTPG
jgi:hypothetical protein